MSIPHEFYCAAACPRKALYKLFVPVLVVINGDTRAEAQKIFDERYQCQKPVLYNANHDESNGYDLKRSFPFQTLKQAIVEWHKAVYALEVTVKIIKEKKASDKGHIRAVEKALSATKTVLNAMHERGEGRYRVEMKLETAKADGMVAAARDYESNDTPKPPAFDTPAELVAWQTGYDTKLTQLGRREEAKEKTKAITGKDLKEYAPVADKDFQRELKNAKYGAAYGGAATRLLPHQMMKGHDIKTDEKIGLKDLPEAQS